MHLSELIQSDLSSHRDNLQLTRVDIEMDLVSRFKKSKKRSKFRSQIRISTDVAEKNKKNQGGIVRKKFVLISLKIKENKVSSIDQEILELTKAILFERQINEAEQN